VVRHQQRRCGLAKAAASEAFFDGSSPAVTALLLPLPGPGVTSRSLSQLDAGAPPTTQQTVVNSEVVAKPRGRRDPARRRCGSRRADRSRWRPWSPSSSHYLLALFPVPLLAHAQSCNFFFPLKLLSAAEFPDLVVRSCDGEQPPTPQRELVTGTEQFLRPEAEGSHGRQCSGTTTTCRPSGSLLQAFRRPPASTSAASGKLTLQVVPCVSSVQTVLGVTVSCNFSFD
jgi:hypothetical protein